MKFYLNLRDNLDNINEGYFFINVFYFYQKRIKELEQELKMK